MSAFVEGVLLFVSARNSCQGGGDGGPAGACRVADWVWCLAGLPVVWLLRRWHGSLRLLCVWRDAAA